MRSLVGRLVLAAGGLVVALLVTELGFRMLKPQDPDVFNWEKIKHRASDNTGRLWDNIPNSSSGSYSGVPVHINALGLRDHEVAVPKPANVFRIVAVGDSITFGFGVRLEETYVKRLEARLNAAVNGSRRRFEVVNAGIDGEGLPYYLHFLRTTAARLEPDLVLVGLSLNDIALYDSRPGDPTGGNAWAWTAVRALNRALLLHSHLYLYSYRSLKSLAYKVGILDINTTHFYDFLALRPPSPIQAEAWRESLALLTDLAEQSSRAHVPVALIVFPVEVQLSARTLDLYRRQLGVRLDEGALAAVPQRRLAEFARAHGVALIDLLPRLRSDPTRAYYLRSKAISHDWMHLSPEGNDVVADEIIGQLRARNLLRGGANGR